MRYSQSQRDPSAVARAICGCAHAGASGLVVERGGESALARRHQGVTAGETALPCGMRWAPPLPLSVSLPAPVEARFKSEAATSLLRLETGHPTACWRGSCCAAGVAPARGPVGGRSGRGGRGGEAMSALCATCLRAPELPYTVIAWRDGYGVRFQIVLDCLCRDRCRSIGKVLAYRLDPDYVTFTVLRGRHVPEVCAASPDEAAAIWEAQP